MITVDQLSFSSFHCQLLLNNVNVSVGTCFLWKYLGRSFIITNWHVVSGRDCFTKNQLSKDALFPDQIKIHFTEIMPSGLKGMWLTFDILTDSDPIWQVHPIYGNNIDIAALPVNGDSLFKYIHLNEVDFQSNLPIKVGDSLFVIGFPYGKQHHSLPIWKRASMAQEPEVMQKHYVFIDTASRPGMSGSPVIRRETGTFTTSEGTTHVVSGAVNRLYGIYSGRIFSSDPNDPQLGIVWPVKLVKDTVSGMRRDTIKEQNGSNNFDKYPKHIVDFSVFRNNYLL